MNARRPGAAGGFGRDAPSRGRRLALAALALMGLTLGGCASLGMPGLCNSCRPPGPMQRLRQRIFNRTPGCNDCGEPGLIGVAAPPVQVLEAPPVVTAPAIVPGGAPVLSNPPPAEEAPLDLKAIEGNGTSSRSEKPSSYQTFRPRDGLQTARHEAPTAAGSGGVDQILKNLVPKLESPAELSGVPPPAEAIAPKPPTPAEEAAPAPSAEAPRTLPQFQPTPDAGAVAPTDPVEAAASLAPGFRSFLSVEPRLAGGCLPDPSGWSWLADQGFRTVLDLRPPDQFRHEDLAQINNTGLRYVALPVSDEGVGDPAVLGRFAAEIAQEAARPLYFFDTDGSRAAVLWYLHRVVDEHGGPQHAAREADEIGPRDPKLWARATAYVDRVQPPAVSPTAPTPPEGPVPDRDASPVNPPAPRAALNLPDTASTSVAPLRNQAAGAPRCRRLCQDRRTPTPGVRSRRSPWRA